MYIKSRFDLRKCITSSENLQQGISEHEIDFKPTDGYHKVLGLYWSYKNDGFIFDFNQIIIRVCNAKISLHSLLSKEYRDLWVKFL